MIGLRECPPWKSCFGGDIELRRILEPAAPPTVECLFFSKPVFGRWYKAARLRHLHGKKKRCISSVWHASGRLPRAVVPSAHDVGDLPAVGIQLSHESPRQKLRTSHPAGVEADDDLTSARIDASTW